MNEKYMLKVGYLPLIILVISGLCYLTLSKLKKKSICRRGCIAKLIFEGKQEYGYVFTVAEVRECML